MEMWIMAIRLHAFALACLCVHATTNSYNEGNDYGGGWRPTYESYNPFSRSMTSLTGISRSPMSRSPMTGLSMAGRPMSGQTMARSPMTGLPMTGRPMTGQTMTGRSMTGRPMTGRSMTGRSMTGRPMTGQSMARSPLTGLPMTGQSFARSPMTGQAVARSPVTGLPMTGQPMAGQAMTGQPMAGQPMAGLSAADGVPPLETLGQETDLPASEIQLIAMRANAEMVGARAAAGPLAGAAAGAAAAPAPGAGTGLATQLRAGGQTAAIIERNELLRVAGERIIPNSAAASHLRTSNERTITGADRQRRNDRRDASVAYASSFQDISARVTPNPTRAQRNFLQSVAQPIPARNTQDEATIIALLETDLGECPIEYTEIAGITCQDVDNRYRRLDGTCNNLGNPQFGMAGHTFERFVPAQYEDGVSTPRETNNGRLLPNARTVSLRLHEKSDNRDLDNTITHLVMQWGQFVDHDLTVAPMMEAEDGAALVCCAEDDDILFALPRAQRLAINEADHFLRSFCHSIPIGIDDAAIGTRSCQPVVRSSGAPKFTPRSGFCGSAPREQFNALTSFVDGSQVYGSSDERSRELRADGGLGATLACQTQNYFEVPGTYPPGTHAQSLLPSRNREDCVLQEEYPCFQAGEERTNEHPALASLQTVLMEEHNRIVREMRRYNRPGVTAEEAFQQARRIVIAILQAITYGEYLPVLIDRPLLRRLDLEFNRQGTFYRGYNPNLNPSMRNAFSTAAFRFGHSLIRTEFRRVGRNGYRYGSLVLSENFERAAEVWNTTLGGPNSLVRGLYQEASQSFDRKGTVAVTDELFGNLDHAGIGMDLFALNNQRGRDHGLPSYVEFLRLCNSRARIPRSFNELRYHDATTRQILSELYERVEDIDLFPGGISERSSGSGAFGRGMLGPTFQCIIARQFELLKKGDRFFFESAVQGTERFNIRQVNEIRNRASMSSLLCQNLAIFRIQPNAFLLPSVPGNRLTSCRNIPRINLRLFAI